MAFSAEAETGRSVDAAAVEVRCACGRQGRCSLGASSDAAEAADRPRLVAARGSLEHALPLKEASGEPAGRGPSPRVFRIGAPPLRRVQASLTLTLTLTLPLTLTLSTGAPPLR